MPVVGLAEVLVSPVFTGAQRKISKEIGPMAERAGRDAGKGMGKGIATGLQSETARLEAEVDKLSRSVAASQDKVTASKSRANAATNAEKTALGALRVAELKLAEARESSRSKASQIAAAEERVSGIRSKVTAATQNRERAERSLAEATDALNRNQRDSASASEKLTLNMRKVADESLKTERNMNRLSGLMSRAFRGRPLAEVTQSIRTDSRLIGNDLDKLAVNIGKEGTRGGRAFTRGFLLVGAGLAGIVPLAGAAGAAVLSASGNVITLAASLGQLAGVAALVPAGLIAIGAGAGVLRTAFAGVGEALTTAIDAGKELAKQGAGAAPNPRIAAMAMEDALRSVADAEKNAADSQEASARRVRDARRSLADAVQAVADAEVDAAEARVNAARRVEDAQRSLRDTLESVAERQKNASRAIERAQRNEAETARDVIKAQQDLMKAREDAAKRVLDLARSVEDAQRSAIEAAKRYQDAIRAFETAQKDPRTDPDQLFALENAVSAAYAADMQAKRDVVNLKGVYSDAQKDAKKGNEQVLSAEERLARARQAQADAIQSRKDAQTDAIKQERDGLRDIADAREAITDALKDQQKMEAGLARSQQRNARAVLDAQEGVDDALKSASESRLDSLRAIEDANRSLERMQLQNADAARATGAEAKAAMDNLTPAARTAVTALLEVYRQLDGIRKIAQENFFTGFAAPLLALSGVVMPQLATGVGAIASALGTGAQDLMNALRENLDGGVLEGLLLGVADAITIANNAIEPLVESFVTLGVVGMPYMSDLAETVVDLSERFNDFIQDAAADGSLVGWIDAGIEAFKDLGSIIGSTFGILGALNDAAIAGGASTSIAELAGGLERIETLMQGATFQDTMATLFSGASAGSAGLIEGLKDLGEAFVIGADAFADFLKLGGEITGLFLGELFLALSNPDFGEGLTTFLEGVKTGVTEMGELMPGLTTAFGDLLSALAPIAEVLGPTLITVFTGFATAIGAVITFLDPLLVLLADSPEVLGLLIGAFLATMAASALVTAAANVQKVASWAVWAATKAWTVATVLANIALGLYTVIVSGNTRALVGNTVATRTARIALVLWSGVTKAAAIAQGLLNAVMRANPIGLVITAIGLLVGALVWFFTKTEAGQKIVKWAWEQIQKGINAVVTWFRDSAVPWFSEAIGKIGRFFTGLYDKYVKPTVDFIKLGFEALTTGIQALPDVFKRMVTKIGEKWAALKRIASSPVEFVINDIINDGLIKTFNLIPGVEIAPLPEFKGFRHGGYTGDKGINEAAGIVHGKEFVFTAEQTAMLGKENLAAMAHAAIRGNAANVVQHDGGGGVPGAFLGNRNAIAQHGAYYLKTAAGMEPWNFPGAARLWDGAAGVKVKMGTGKHQGYVSPLERGGGILGYTTGTNIDMSPSWMNQLNSAARQTVSAHEIGHALGLPHDTAGRSMMAPGLGAMASVPTERDIRNLQRLYPGGTGKAGEAAENPFTSGILGGLIDSIKKAFPQGGMFIDAGIGLVTNGFNQLQKIVSDIAKGILELPGKVFSTVKSWFGGGGDAEDSATLLRDTGGILPPGVSRVINNTGQNEMISNPAEIQALKNLAVARSGATAEGLQIEARIERALSGWQPMVKIGTTQFAGVMEETTRQKVRD